jgi:MFS family permease
MSDHIGRVAVMEVGVVITTLCTLLLLWAQGFAQLLVLRLVTGIGLGCTISAPLPIAAELVPARHRRIYAGIYEVILASAFTLCRLSAVLPGGVMLFVAPVLISESPRWPLRRGRIQDAVDTVRGMGKELSSPRPMLWSRTSSSSRKWATRSRAVRRPTSVRCSM